MLYLEQRLRRILYKTTKDSSLLRDTFFRIKPSREKRFHVFCVGLPRSGTHSIANIFAKNYRASHEPLHVVTIKKMFKIYENELKREEVTDFLIHRDRLLQLELEAAHYLHKVVPDLVRINQDAKFILTVREPMSWIESEINKNYLSEPGSHWEKLEEYRYVNGSSRVVNSNIIKYSLSSYLKYFNYHINHVVDNVPADRLLIINTFNISKGAKKIARFVGIDPDTLEMNNSHSAKRVNKKIQLDAIVDKDELSSEIEKICGNTIREKVPMLLKHMPYLS